MDTLTSEAEKEEDDIFFWDRKSVTELTDELGLDLLYSSTDL